jgi:NTP pyrophosphatase (non-canonical NTP hydrolase)|tara:strand:+ start:8133 stop:8510 length:378 start_codon:yes stop_codon:yes gene_type:complete
MNIKEIQKEIHKVNVKKGFWVGGDRNVGEMLMLVVSELGEAIEAHRSGRKALVELFNVKEIDRTEPSDYQNDFEQCIKDTFEDEVADAVIRIMDMCEGLGIDLERHIDLKLEYNRTRPYKHGKKY